MIRVTNQAELDGALAADPNAEIDINATARLHIEIATGNPILRLLGSTVMRMIGRGSSTVSVAARESSTVSVAAWGSSTVSVEGCESSTVSVAAWGSSTVSVAAWESSTVSMAAWGSSTVSVEGCESSTVSVAAWGSSTVSVVAWGYAQLSLSGARIKASAGASVAVRLDCGATAEGGMQTTVRRHTPLYWCDYYSIPVENGVAVLFKAVSKNFMSPRGGNYTPGTVPVADDWDDGIKECGGGLHFSPSPRAARRFNPDAECYVACPVALADFVVHPDGDFPEKVKARGCCAPVWECDSSGRRRVP